MNSLLAIRVATRSARPGIGEWKTDPGGHPFLEVRVAAAPTDGSANAEVLALIAKALKVPRSSIRIVRGETSRLKRLEVPLSEGQVRCVLGG